MEFSNDSDPVLDVRMDRPSISGNMPERKSILPKPLTPVGHGIGSSALGAKIPAHMTPEDKSKFLLKLEAYRKQKMQAKQDLAGKSKIPSIIPHVVRAKPPVTSMTKPVEDFEKNEMEKDEKEGTQKDEMRTTPRNEKKVTPQKEKKEVLKQQNHEIHKEYQKKEVVREEKPEVKKVERKEVKKDEKKEVKKDERREVKKDEKKEVKKVEKKEVKKDEKKEVKKDGETEGKKEEKENVFERLFRKSTRVSMAKKVEKVEPKMMEPPRTSRVSSIKPKKTNSSSSLKHLVKVPVSPKPKTNVEIEPEPEPKLPQNVELEPKLQNNVEPEPKLQNNVEPEPKMQHNVEPEPKLQNDVELEPKPNDDVEMEPIEMPIEKLPWETVPEPEVTVEVATEPLESQMDIELPEEPKQEVTEAVEKLPDIIVSEPEEVEKDIINRKVPMSEEKVLKKGPTVKFASEKKVTVSKKLDNEIKKPLLANPTRAQKEKEKKIKMRRSISMIHRKKIGNAETAIHRTVSEHDLSFTEPEVEVKEDEPRERSKSVTFMTPKAKTPTPSNLRDKLESWLNDRGHSISGYRHLNCFGVHQPANPPTPAFQTPKNKFNESLERSQYATAPNTPCEDSDKENMTPTPATAILRIDIEEVEGWLTDLHKLIVELKYPHNRCEEWLAAIRRKCIGCTQLPAYWECLAALEESRGEMNAAIEYYERAIIKGAEVNEIGDSLEQLFDKLIIDKDRTPSSKPDRNVDPKNIFKSTIIKFALQQKAVKELGPEIGTKAKQQLYVATPVRRSSRIQTPYKQHVVSSLKSLDPDSLEFHTNKFLLPEK